LEGFPFTVLQRQQPTTGLNVIKHMKDEHMKPGLKLSLLVAGLACFAVGLTAISVSNYRSRLKPASTQVGRATTISSAESSPATARIATALTPTAITTPAIEEPPDVLSAPAPTTGSKGEVTIVLQRPAVPGGVWTMKQGNTVRQYSDRSVTPRLRALLGNDRAATLLVHMNADGSFKVFRRLD
jgi:hypothetical protein